MASRRLQITENEITVCIGSNLSVCPVRVTMTRIRQTGSTDANGDISFSVICSRKPCIQLNSVLITPKSVTIEVEKLGVTELEPIKVTELEGHRRHVHDWRDRRRHGDVFGGIQLGHLNGFEFCNAQFFHFNGYTLRSNQYGVELYDMASRLQITENEITVCIGSNLSVLPGVIVTLTGQDRQVLPMQTVISFSVICSREAMSYSSTPY